MTTIKQLKEKLNRIDPLKLAEAVLKRHEADLADLNREQLLDGNLNTGDGIIPTYAWEWFANEKHSMNSRPGYGTPDLYLTGAFHRSITAKVSGDTIIFDASDDKKADLEGQYSNDIFGLTPQSKEDLIREWLLREMIAAFFK